MGNLPRVENNNLQELDWAHLTQSQVEWIVIQ